MDLSIDLSLDSSIDLSISQSLARLLARLLNVLTIMRVNEKCLSAIESLTRYRCDAYIM